LPNATAQSPRLNPAFASWGKLTVDNKAQQERLAIVNSRAAERIEIMNAVLITRQTEGFEAAQRLIASGRPLGLVKQFRESLNGMGDEERLLLRHRLLADEASQGKLSMANC
jgi:CHASE3 domain sensor protein